MGTYMISDMNNLASTFPLSPDIPNCLLLIDLDIDVECIGKCFDLQAIGIGCFLGHSGEIQIPILLELFWSWCRDLLRSSNGLSLGVSTIATTDFCAEEIFIPVRIVSHLLDNFGSDFVATLFVAIELV